MPMPPTFPPKLRPQRSTSTTSNNSDQTGSFYSVDTLSNEKRSLDLTQRIERRLAVYNASSNIFKRWVLELISWFLSAICMGAVVGIYLRINGARMNTNEFALNCANVLGKIASAMLIMPTSEALGQLKWHWFHSSNAIWDFEIFDKASRGPWGAALLLYRTKGRSLAALGAFLIVLLLAIDTFFQQVVDFPYRWALQDAHGEISSVVRYEPEINIQMREGMSIATGDPYATLVVDQFSYGNGTRKMSDGNGTRADIPLSCPTSNCTWPLYETLGICSQCADISEYLDFACIDGRVDWTSNLTGGGFDIEDTYPNATMCGYFLNFTLHAPIMMSGYIESPGSDTSISNEALLMRTMPLVSVFDKTPLYGNGSIKFSHVRNAIADVLIVSAANGSSSSVYDRQFPAAHECVLSYCVKTIKSYYDWGAYHEEVVSTLYNTTTGPFPWQTREIFTGYQHATDIFYAEDVNINISRKSDERRSRIFGTSNDTLYSMMMLFDDIFPSVFTVKPNEPKPLLRYRTWLSGPAYNRYLDYNPWLAPNNISAHMERWAIALTNVIRSGSSSEVVEGAAYSMDTFVNVRWEWLTFPFTLLLLSLAFLVSTIIKTSKDTETGIWKTSAMPTLIYGLPEDTRGKLAAQTMSNSLHGDKKKVRIKLLPDRGWRVSGQSLLKSPILPLRKNQLPPGWI